ncbi:hypothetical protein NUW54_g8558 [Trametes sanguinea]|uniref:Uncharacterized protein n=1 Tax=Trametes sanguinea TaxID=158606 RepID=A0ACC1PE89_9APHY|nr:hypothetical protein NUW54_g8558 [Trametes sanguinea]
MAPAGTTKLSPIKRSQIVALCKEGLTYGQIAARLGVARSTCCKTFQRYKAHKTFHSLRRSGHPRALTLHDKQIIICTIRQHHFWSYKKVQIEAGGYTELQVHWVTRKAGYRRSHALLSSLTHASSGLVYKEDILCPCSSVVRSQTEDSLCAAYRYLSMQ